MPLEISEDIVSLAYQSLGYFVIEGRGVGVREIDLLALRLGDNGQVAERLHVEVSVSTRPIGVLREKAPLGTSARHPDASAQAWAGKKFDQESVKKVVKSAFGTDNFKRVFVHGRLKEPAQLKALEAKGIECVAIGDLVNRALESGTANRLRRALEISALLTGRTQASSV